MRDEDLRIPAVAGIVSHLSGIVLTESEILAVDAGFEEEKVHPTHKVAASQAPRSVLHQGEQGAAHANVSFAMIFFSTASPSVISMGG